MVNHASFLKQATSIIALSCLPGVALADVTAQQVWEMWKSNIESQGTTLSVGATSEADGKLILSNVSGIAESPPGQPTKTRVSINIDRIEFAEQGDGTVRVSMSADIPWSISITPQSGEEVDLTMILREAGLNIVVSGQPGDIAYEYTADSISLGLDKLIVEGKEMPFEGQIDLETVTGSGSMADNGAVRANSSDMKAARASYHLAFADPEGQGKFTASSEMQNLTYTAGSRMPAGINFRDPGAMFSDGVVASGELSIGASSSLSDLTGTPGGKDDMHAESSADSTKISFALDNGAVGYGALSKGVNFVFRSNAIPFPQLALSAEETAADILIPLTRTDAPRPFKAVLRIVGLNPPDELWGMFDPGQVMPREPFTLNIDLAGKMRWLVTPFDETEMAKFGDASPVEVEKVDINNIELKGVGARLLAQGAFSLDNSKGPVPVPEGALDLRAEGINGLLDNLIKMGLLPEDNANGMRMMLGLFARPGGGEDVLVSKIELKADGSIYANGQQLK